MNNVAPELNVEVSDDISAANMTAISMPRSPAGRIRNTNVGYAMFEHAMALPQASWQTSPSTQATSSVKRIREIIPGIIIRNMGVILINPARTQPILAFERSLAARVL